MSFPHLTRLVSAPSGSVRALGYLRHACQQHISQRGVRACQQQPFSSSYDDSDQYPGSSEQYSHIVTADGFTVVYTDGACSRNGQEGARAGIGVYFGYNDPRNHSAPLTGSVHTNQRAEVTAAIEGIQRVAATESVEVRTDSTYTIQAATNWIPGWKRKGWLTAAGKPVKNRDLMEVLDDLTQSRGDRLRWVHVAGHKGEPGNEEADRLAVEGARLASDMEWQG